MTLRTGSIIPRLACTLAIACVVALGLSASFAVAQDPGELDKPKPQPPAAGAARPAGLAQPAGAHAATGVGAIPAGVGETRNFSGPGVVFDTPVHDYGRVMSGPNVAHDFWFTNPGTDVLRVTNVRTSCGCTTAGAWDREIPPGESGRIPIQISTAKVSGKFSKTITVDTNVKESPQVMLRIEGEVWRPVEVTPPHLSFGRLTANATQPMTAEATIVNNMTEPLEIKGVTSQNPAFRAEAIPIETGKRYKLVVTANPPFATGNLTSQIKIQTNIASSPEVLVVASAYVPEPVQLMPAILNIPTQAPNPYEKQVYVRNNSGQPIEIRNIKCPDSRLEVSVAPRPPEQDHVLTVKFPANYIVPPGGVQITMETSLESTKNLTLRVIQPTIAAQTARRPPTAARPTGVTPTTQPATPGLLHKPILQPGSEGQSEGTLIRPNKQ